MTSLNLYDQYECDQAYMNNLCELESVISQYIEVNNINTELVDRIICKVMMNENYEKINDSCMYVFYKHCIKRICGWSRH